jgi:tetratricopeptide (TPR) repeat protein
VPSGGGAPRTKAEAKQLLAAGSRAVSSRDSTSARRSFERVVKGKYYVGEGYVGLARVAFEDKDFGKAATMAKKAIENRGGTAAHLWLAHALFKDGKYKEAVKEYEIVVAKDPKNADAKQALAKARQRAGQ